MLGSCTDRCGPCEGCFGGFSQEGCKLRWATSGNPYAVEVRLSGVILSVQKSGFLVNPSSGSYELWAKCNAGDEWELLDVEDWVKRSANVCRPCCMESGAYSSPGSAIYVNLNCGSNPFWSLYNGTIQLTNQSCACKFSGGWGQSFPTEGDPVNSNPRNGVPCSLPTLPARHWLAGRISEGPCPGNPLDWNHIYDIYWIPTSATITQLSFGGEPGICQTSNPGVSLTLLLTMAVFKHRIDLGNPAFPNGVAPKCWERIPSGSVQDGPFLAFSTNECGSVSFLSAVDTSFFGATYGCTIQTQIPNPGSTTLSVSVLMP